MLVCVLSLLLSRIMENQAKRTIESITRDLDYPDVVPIHVEDSLVFVSSDDSMASDILRTLGVPYPKILGSAHKKFQTIVWKHSQNIGPARIL